MFILADIYRIRGLQADDKTINQGSQYNFLKNLHENDV